MEYLEATLAFAVVMIILATFVTGLVEIAARSLALRSRVLAVMLQRFVERELLPLVLAKIEDARTAAGKSEALPKIDARKVVEQLIVNPVAFSLTSPWEKAEHIGRSGRVENLSVYAFLQRFAKTGLGRALAAECRDQLQPILVDMARTYERYAAASREVFRRKANYISGIVAIALAFALNVNAPVLFSYLVANPAARDVLIAQSSNAYEAFQQQEARMAAALDELETPQAEEGAAGADEALAEDAQTAEDAQMQDAARDEQATAELRESFEVIQAQADTVAALGKLGLPILGQAAPFDRADWCRAVVAWEEDGDAKVAQGSQETGGDTQADAGENGTAAAASDAPPAERDPCLKDNGEALSFKELVRSGWTLLVWVPGVLLGGVLIGLGGPFWFRVFESLSQLLQVLRGLRGVNREEAADPTDPDKPEGGGTPQAAKTPEKMTEAFLIAAGQPTSTPSGAANGT